MVNDLQKTLDDWNTSGNDKTIDSTTRVGINEPISFFIVYSINEEKTNLRLYYHITILISDRTFINGRLRDYQYLGLKISNGIPEVKANQTSAQPTVTAKCPVRAFWVSFGFEAFRYLKSGPSAAHAL